MLTPQRLVALAGYILIAGCSGDSPPGSASDAAGIAALQTFAFTCEGNGYIVADFRRGDDLMWIFLHDRTVQLDRVESASGAKYSKGDITFWTHGTEAQLEVGGVADHCKENRRASIFEDAKLRGVDFRGTGNEPGWVLEIGPEGLMLSTNYGEDRYQFPAVPPEEDSAKRVTVYRSKAGEHSLNVRLIGTRCQDSMSGDAFETTVEIDLDGSGYRGCGQPLH